MANEIIEVIRYDGQTFKAELLPERGGKTTSCRDCKAPIRFARTDRGSNMPVSESETATGEFLWKAHHNVCPNPSPRPPRARSEDPLRDL